MSNAQGKAKRWRDASRSVIVAALCVAIAACASSALRTEEGSKAKASRDLAAPAASDKDLAGALVAPNARANVLFRKTAAPATAVDLESLASPATVGPPGPHWMAAHVINVGQGDATLLEFPCGVVLIDAGGEKAQYLDSDEALAAYLNAFFDRRDDLDRILDLVVVSHPHMDHSRGISALADADHKVLPAVHIRNVIVSSFDRAAPHAESAGGWKPQDALKHYVQHDGGKFQSIAFDASPAKMEGLKSPLLDAVKPCPADATPVHLRALWGGAQSMSGAAWNNPNNSSVVVRVDYGKASFLFLGDAEDEAGKGAVVAMLDRYKGVPSIFDVDVLKVGHHGSENGTDEALLRATTPCLATLSSGDLAATEASHSAYDYGHPRSSTMALLTDPDVGVSASRRAVSIVVADTADTHGAAMTLNRGVYGTAWDGSFAVYASALGKYRVRTENAGKTVPVLCK